MAVNSAQAAVASEIADALTQLFSREVRVTAVKAPEPTQLVVRYIDGSGNLVSAWTFERPLAWSLGAALTMMPPDLVREAIRRGQPDASFDENFQEVVNVLATVAANRLSRRSVLESVTHDLETLQRTARQISAAGARWSVLDVQVEDYPGGRIAISLVPSGAE
jgi:hypothetical protein